MSDANRPVPTPRPRQLKPTSDEIDATVGSRYENHIIKPHSSLSNTSLYDALHERLGEMRAEMERPVPTPRSRVTGTKSVYENTTLNNLQPDLPPKTGAIRKAPNIPKVENNLSGGGCTRDDEKIAESEELRKDTDDILSISSSSGNSNSDKYTTPRPSDILKSIGESSKILKEAIGERITDKAASTKHKIMKEYKHSMNALGSFTSDTTTKTIKSVKAKIGHLSLGRPKVRRSLSNDLEERPQTINIGNDEMLQTLTFNSPLNNQRANNLENIPAHLYEVPKSSGTFKYRSSEDLPTYEDVPVGEEFRKRNTKLSQSLKQNNVHSDTHLNTISSNDSSDDDDSQPPSIPPPQLLPLDEPVYGRVKRIYENAPIIPLRKPPPPPGVRKSPATSEPSSNRATISDDSLNRNGVDRSDSWRYVSSDNVSRLTVDSSESTEPIYANDENERIPGPSTSSMMSVPLEPKKILNTESQRHATMTRDILNEFDPLSRESFDQFVSNNMNHLTLLETLLGEETYGTVADSTSIVSAELIDETSSDDLNHSDDQAAVAAPPSPLPLPPERRKNQQSEPQRQQSVIIHQNLRLKGDSIENLVEPFLAKVNDPPPPATSHPETVDLGRPKTTKTSWFVDADDSERFAKNNLDNPKNFTHAPADKVTKTVPKLTKVNNLAANRDSASYLPSYEESKNDEVVTRAAGEEKTNILNELAKSGSSIFNRMLGGSSSNAKEKKPREPKDFAPRPPFGEEPLHHNDKSVILFKLPSGVIEDMLKELNPRFIELRRRQFKAFADPEMKVLKEHLDLNHLSSVHYLANHKFSDFKTECGRQIHCFEINLAVPKHSGNTSVVNALLDSKGSPVRTQRVTYVYGIHSKQEKCMWMQKVIRSLTGVFPKEYTCDYVRSGWCYMKKSITSAWSGTWVLLSRRRLLFYDFTESRLEIMDLRKARCIGLKENSNDTENLLVERGPIMLIDAPPFTVYLVMGTVRETKIWSVVIKDEAHANGTQLRHQQLTKDNVPVFVDKCINFVYTNGTMSEGIYRKAGSTSNIQRLITALRKDAFDVQITRSEYNEHDVSSALKRFFRELPEPLMGKLAVSFLSVCEMKNHADKILAYRELLQRLPSVEYQTLKKLLGHLHFIQTQKDVNKMKAENLAMVFGPTLMQPQNNENQYSIDHRDTEVIAALIVNYKKLYDLTPDEIKTEQIMLTVLQKYHNAAENLSDTVKKSGDFKVWITLDCNPELNTKQEDKRQVNLSLTPTKTVAEVCKELEPHMKLAAHKMTLMEVILNGELQRPIHYNEKVLNVVLRWSNWPEADRKTNYLELRPQTKFQQQIERAMRTLPSLTPCTKLMFADKRTKTLKQFTLELSETTINVLKTEKSSNVKVNDVDVSNCVTYLGAEKKRDNQCRWALTLVELNFNKRGRDSPFIGHVLAGNDINEQITWYTSIMHSIYGYEISPSPEIVIA